MTCEDERHDCRAMPRPAGLTAVAAVTGYGDPLQQIAASTPPADTHRQQQALALTNGSADSTPISRPPEQRRLQLLPISRSTRDRGA